MSSYLPLVSIYLVAAIRLLPGISLIASSQSRISLGQYAVTQIINDIDQLKNKNLKISNIRNQNQFSDEFESLKFKNVNFFIIILE